MRAGRRGQGGGLAAALMLALASSPAWAVGAGEAPGAATRDLHNIDLESNGVRQAIANARAAEKTPEQRIADGETLLKTKDYARAIVVLNEVVERYRDDAQHPASYPDALSMLGDAYFESHQFLSARRAFRAIVDKPSDRRMAPYVPHAYARLVDIALRKQNYVELDEVLARMNQWPGGSGESTMQYARAKALLIKKDFAGARVAVGGVPPGHPLYPQARYLLGTVMIREAQAQAQPVKLAPGDAPPAAPPTRYAAAIEAFRQVTVLPPDTADHRDVIDYAWLAIGRLFYEADQWLEAADAYNHVDRTSNQFGTALYELAWVYVRLGDADRASRALEVLSIADPKNAYLADGTLLRADLMLRAGQFDKALTVYQNVRGEYDPMRQRVDGFLSSTNDPAVYYDKLAAEQLEGGDANGQLPPLAVQWAREAQDGPAAFAVLDDVGQCRDLLRQSQALVAKMRIILNAPNRVRAFPDLRAGDEKLVQLLNRVSLARVTVAQGLDEVESREVPGELARVRADRRALQARIAQAPVTDGDIAARDASAQRQWNGVSQHLQQLQLEVDQMQAVVNGLKRLVGDGHAVAQRDPATVQSWRDQLVADERDLKAYRDQIDGMRRSVDAGKIQVGYGDQRYLDDDAARAAYRNALAQELRLVASGQAGVGAQAYSARVAPILASADASEARLTALRADIGREVERKVAEVNGAVEKEAALINGYTAQLETLDQEARLVVGQVAMRNFALVRDKLKNIVLRADVGTVEESWEVREEQVTRVRNLQVERVREEQILKEELREVLDDATDPEPAPGGPAPTSPSP